MHIFKRRLITSSHNQPNSRATNMFVSTLSLTLIFFTAPLLVVAKSESQIINVGTTSEFQAALRSAAPGVVIQLSPGEYYGFFRLEISGTEAAPIVIQGTHDSILSSWSSAITLEASWVILRNLTLADSKKGILIEGGNFNVLENLVVHDIDEEGVHFRLSSSDNILRNSRIYNIGKTRPGYGEGVYIGQDFTKWDPPTEPDFSDRNVVRNNVIGPCAGENIDIKEGTCCGRIEGNTFNGKKMSNVNSDDSWMDIRGNYYTIMDNVGVWTLKDGIQVRSHMPPGEVSGCKNIFRRNSFNLTGNTGGVAIFLHNIEKCENSSQIYSDNVVLTGEPLSNGWVIPANKTDAKQIQISS